jgi:glucose-1-phosphate adenylyltransferase
MMNEPTKAIQIRTENVLTVVLGGGQGTRLFPLTKARSKPAVPLGGKYRLVDIPISNCLNSGLRRIYVLTQFNSTSLHRHISQSYKFDHFSPGFVEILAAQQTLTDTSWYQGTADAVRKNLIHLLAHSFDLLLVLSGDQLYRMDYRTLLAQHMETRADVTVATVPVPRCDVAGFGIMQMDAEHCIVRFVEKPKDTAVQDSLRLERQWYPKLGIREDRELFLASMGIYVFNRQGLVDLLNNDQADFGKHIIPKAIQSHRVCAHVFQGYWEDIGTVRAFFEANLELARAKPRFSFFDPVAPVFTHPRFLPASWIDGGNVTSSLVSDGCVLDHAEVNGCLVGIRSRVAANSSLHRVVMMGADQYETEDAERWKLADGIPPTGIGTNTRIENAIIDKNARIGNDCVIRPDGKPDTLDHELYYIRDGIVIIPKGGVVPNGTVI